VLGRAHGRCSWGGHSVRYGTSYVSRHCIRIGTVLEQLDGGTATRVADAADAADADCIVPQPEHTPHTHRGRGSALAPDAYLYCTPLTVRRSRSRSHREQRQVSSMRQNAPVDVGAVLAQLHGYGLFFLRKCLFFSQKQYPGMSTHVLTAFPSLKAQHLFSLRGDALTSGDIGGHRGTSGDIGGHWGT
jgi:hypothetical protein